MLKKFTFAALTFLFTLCMIGCGDDKSAGDKNSDASKVEGSADKAVLAYAQLNAYGIIEDENQAAAGMAENDIKDVQDRVLAQLVQAFQNFPLSDENIDKITKQYVAKLHVAMNLKTTIKKDDPKNPVVELTARTINRENTDKVAETDENLLALGNTLYQLQLAGFTYEQLKNDPNFQAAAMETISNFISEFQLNDEKSIDITCEALKGSDGKMHWAPQNPQDITKFVNGQK